ncbi:hypothetical protein ZWY2020_009927 [Hordeum vulgare]|nr:hypothetical protein ZWY2020_009927 [Hordeum vulgare]
MYGKEITVADREMVEERADQMLSEATETDVGLGGMDYSSMNRSQLLKGGITRGSRMMDLGLRDENKGFEASLLSSYAGENLETIFQGQTFHAPSEISL